jgi:ankyrin repeat protein
MKRQLFFTSISTLFYIVTSLGSIHVFDEEHKAASVELSLLNAVFVNSVELIEKSLADGHDIDEQDAFGNTALILAVKRGFLRCVCLLVSREASLKVSNYKGKDVFYYALKKRGDKSVRLQLIDGLMVKAAVQDSKGMMAELVKDYFIETEQSTMVSYLFFDALEASCLSIMEDLISRKFSINTDYYFTHDILGTKLFAHPIVFAGLCGQAKVYTFLLRKGAEATACDVQFKRTAFHWAAFLGDEKFFECIIKKHKKKYEKMRSLSTIALGNYVIRAIGKDLIAVPDTRNEEAFRVAFRRLFNVTDIDECTPGFLAVEEGHIKVVDLLLRHDYFVNVNAQNKNGYGPLHLAAKRGNSDLCALLLLKGSDSDALANGKDKGLTALALAAANGHKDVVELLIGYNANIEGVEERDGNFERGILNSRRNNQKVRLPTPLELAAIGGHAEVVKLLSSRGAVVRVPTKSKETTLIHLIARKVAYEHQINDLGYNDVVAFLIAKGIKVDAVDEQGKTAFDYAVQDGRKSVAEALKAYAHAK